MKVSVTTLIENTLGEHLQLHAEHGLSFYVEAGERKFIFDTGSSNLFLKNAELLGIDLKVVDSVFISHGHYDHSGGYNDFRAFRGAEGSELFVRPGFFDKKYGIKNNSVQFLGNAFTREEIEAEGVKVNVLTDNVVEVFPNVFSISGFERNCEIEKVNPRFMIERGEEREIDDFSDEQSIVIRSLKGLVVLVGCSHPGIINILETVKKNFDEKIYAVIGGTHLVEADDARLEYTTEYIINEGIPMVGFSHCSGGDEHLVRMIERLGSRFFHNRTGTMTEFC